MSKRLYFLVPDVDTCRSIVAELDEIGISESHTHVIGNHFTPLDGLHEASFLQKSEFTHGVEEGLGVGGVAGLLGGLLAVTFPPAGLVLGGGALLTSALAGAGLGAIISAVVAKDIPSRKLQSFEDAISEGQLLLLVDVPKKQAKGVIEVIQKHHPEVEFGETAPSPSLGKS
uniref:DUF1269 domain-containing protein n=1 Tax=Candidatus Kentrum sp. MB TaxID=2138164 RepID=A0A451B8C1_9GAMM|nr:MAG: hypothetical protein BECKMB1821G_GA0114241_100358 [Candidatus Kentron sp. MB]VFK26575.1 MAG: hypothetical protein BECKMB1821I_GA0114274_100144 [Candidatus Kentron sp. MB]VFK74539.1 MAG: hypothetical protein BECKMB1821H_GA0114242_100630 [Candidatus Kentron sp. MB]